MKEHVGNEKGSVSQPEWERALGHPCTRRAPMSCKSSVLTLRGAGGGPGGSHTGCEERLGGVGEPELEPRAGLVRLRPGQTLGVWRMGETQPLTPLSHWPTGGDIVMVPELGQRCCPPLGPSSLSDGSTGPSHTPASDRCPAVQEGLCLRGDSAYLGWGGACRAPPAPHQPGDRAWGALGAGAATCLHTLSSSSVTKQDSLDLHVTQCIFADWVQPALHVTDGRLPPGPAL